MTTTKTEDEHTRSRRARNNLLTQPALPFSLEEGEAAAVSPRRLCLSLAFSSSSTTTHTRSVDERPAPSTVGVWRLTHPTKQASKVKDPKDILPQGNKKAVALLGTPQSSEAVFLQAVRPLPAAASFRCSVPGLTLCPPP